MQTQQEVFEAVNEALKAVSSLVRGGFAGSKASMTVADLGCTSIDIFFIKRRAE